MRGTQHAQNVFVPACLLRISGNSPSSVQTNSLSKGFSSLTSAFSLFLHNMCLSETSEIVNARIFRTVSSETPGYNNCLVSIPLCKIVVHSVDFYSITVDILKV